MIKYLLAIIFTAIAFLALSPGNGAIMWWLWIALFVLFGLSQISRTKEKPRQ